MSKPLLLKHLTTSFELAPFVSVLERLLAELFPQVGSLFLGHARPRGDQDGNPAIVHGERGQVGGSIGCGPRWFAVQCDSVCPLADHLHPL